MQLTFRERALLNTQVDVFSGQIAIALVYKVTSAPATSGELWSWTFLLSAAPAGFQHHGSQATRELACLSVERNWEAWLKAAGLNYVSE